MANSRNKWLVGAVAAVTVSGATLWEGKRNDPHIPVPGDRLTVCYGETNVEMRHYSNAECLAMLKTSLVEYGNGVLSCVNVPINQSQHAAYTLFAYNLGVPTFCKSMSVRMLNAGRAEESCKWLATDLNTGRPNYSTAGGVYYRGLQNRRIYERDLCLKGLK
jgi:lysozyme